MAANAPKRLVAAMRSCGDAHVQKAACGAIINLVLGSAARSDKLIAAGVVDALVDTMRKQELKAGVQRACCKAIWTLASGSDARKEAMVSAGVPALLRQALSCHLVREDVVEQASGALKAIRSVEDDELRRQIDDAAAPRERRRTTSGGSS
mmetsp:Transcript_12779/g.47213  ORF Transcript_12779/g.47213 Transcript_12779/m.47213 type:complete len:151 (-) Transcript_12779:2383-2835(-)